MTVTIGTVTLPESEVAHYYESGLYLVMYTKVYQLFYTAASRQYYGQMVFHLPREKGQPGLVKRGRYKAMTAEQVNRLIGFDLLRV